MTRKDYRLIATVLAEYVDREGRGESVTMPSLTIDLATAIKASNPNFDRTKFINAVIG